MDRGGVSRGSEQLLCWSEKPVISQEEIRKHINNVIPSQLSPQIVVGERRKGKKEENKEESTGRN